MLLIRPSTEILFWACDNQLIEQAGRTCYKSECRGEPDKFVKFIQSKQHLSVIEHSLITVKFIVDRGVSHELVRHRLCSFSQESTRYCDYLGKGVCFVIPPWVNILPGLWDGPRIQNEANTFTYPDFRWICGLIDAEKTYVELRQYLWRPQQARSVLPNALKTEIVLSANAREWQHIFELRCATSAHPQMREVMVPLSKEFNQRNPILFKDYTLCQ